MGNRTAPMTKRIRMMKVRSEAMIRPSRSKQATTTTTIIWWHQLSNQSRTATRKNILFDLFSFFEKKWHLPWLDYGFEIGLDLLTILVLCVRSRQVIVYPYCIFLQMKIMTSFFTFND